MKDKKGLLLWYEAFGRDDLPWRQTSNDYHVYLSEIMLQQTQVSRVKEYYYPQFLSKFPTFEAISLTTLDEVLGLWSGLGYYARANNLYEVARICAKEGLPKSYDGLIELPGVGRYTASAICSFAHNQTTAVVDTNISRVLCRYFALRTPSQKLIWEKAFEFLNTTSSREHNLALMDLGAMVCTPKEPKCEICPLQGSCQGKTNPELFTQIKKMIYEKHELHLGVYIGQGEVALYKSQESLYKNLLTLPEVKPKKQDFISSFNHSYTRYKLTVNLYKLATPPTKDGLVMVSLDRLFKAPISSLTKKAILSLS